MYRRRDINDETERLEKLTSLLQICGVSVLIGVLGQLLILIIGVFNMITTTSKYQLIPNMSSLAILSIALFATDITLLIAYEVLKRNADAIFNELNNKVQKIFASKEEDASIDDFRYPIRRFMYAAELPIFPGKWGPFVVLLFNIIAVTVFMGMLFFSNKLM